VFTVLQVYNIYAAFTEKNFIRRNDAKSSLSSISYRSPSN